MWPQLAGLVPTAAEVPQLQYRHLHDGVQDAFLCSGIQHVLVGPISVDGFQGKKVLLVFFAVVSAIVVVNVLVVFILLGICCMWHFDSGSFCNCPNGGR